MTDAAAAPGAAAPDAAAPDAVARRAGRVLLVDAARRVLLLQAVDPARPDDPYWMTPGGGLDPGEDAATAAARELYEETGLLLTPESLGARVRQEVIEFPYDGVWYRQRQEYFLVRIESHTVAPVALTELETASWRGARWWSTADLLATNDRYYPPDLVDLLGGLIATTPREGVGC